MRNHKISTKDLTFETLRQVLDSGAKLELSREAAKKVARCRTYLNEKMADGNAVIYGINTGFGSLHNHTINKQDREKLQTNLVISHACGMGNTVPLPIVRLMLLLKIQGLSYGHSGVQVETIQRLIDFYNHDMLPVVFEQGSLGASGDLAPLAHLSLPLIGLGELWYKGKRTSTTEVYKKMKWKPVRLRSKEGLALLNGTQFMSAYGAWSVMRATQLLAQANTIAALSLDAYDGRPEPFDEAVHKVRPHKGQLHVSAAVRKLLRGSQLTGRAKKHVQDPYSFRCIPQVHGASYDAINYVASVFHTEINSVTDNPTIFPDEDKIISAGNFHGQPLAFSLDFLAIAIAELASISERRTYKLISGQRGLPDFLVANPGLNSGFMIPQYTAASMVSQNKQLCTPASVDTIDSSNGQEDHVSMGANSAVKIFSVMRNVESVLAIELMTAAQALEFRRPVRTSKPLEKLLASFRKQVAFLYEDRLLHNDMQRALAFVNDSTNWE